MSAFDAGVVAEAEATIDKAIAELLSLRGQGAVIGVAPAGAGKSYAIGTAVERARAKKLRVAVATPTNEQAHALISDLAKRMPKEMVTFVPASARPLPEDRRRPNIQEKTAKEVASDKLLVGTLNKLGDAFARGDLSPVDILLVDEAFQANAVHYYGVGDLAPRHLLVGDSGQLAPFTSAPESDRWRGLGEDPLLTAIEVLRHNHPLTTEHKLPITRRLDPRAVPVVRAFYPDHEFKAAVLPGVRRLELAQAAGVREYRQEDAVLERARTKGWAHLELPDSAALTADPATTGVIVRLVRRLLERTPRVSCERTPRGRALAEEEIAVVVSHNDQKDLLRVELAAAGFEHVGVNTANKVQGLTYEVVIAWHPLAGLMETDDFHLDPGRLCVMLTRHRQACIVVGRAADRELVDGIPPATPAYVGWDHNPALKGWYAHEAVFAALADHRLDYRT